MLQQTTCLFCGGTSGEYVIRENGFGGKQCPACRLIYITPRPGENDVIELYEKDAAHGAAAVHIAGRNIARLQAWHCLRVIRRHVARGRLLEIGPGGGWFLDEAGRVGYSPFAVELNPIQAAFIRDGLGIPCETKAFSAESFNGTSFDLIYHRDVISHLHDPIASFRLMRQRLASGGFLVFETGNGGDINPKYYPLIEQWQYPDHLYLFSESNLLELLRRTRFQLVAIRRYSIVPQLLALRAYRKVRITARRGLRSTKGAQKQEIALRREGQITTRIAQLLGVANHMLRYHMGALAPKTGRPQTLLIVAQAS